MKATILLAVITAISLTIGAQNGAIHGKVLDEYGSPLYGANIVLVDAASTVGTMSDFDGEFKIKPLNAGTYTVEVSFIGYNSVRITGVSVYNNKITFLEDVGLSTNINFLDDIVVLGNPEELLNRDEPQKITLSNTLIDNSAGPKNPVAIIARLVPDVQVVNNQMVVRGSRPGSSTVYIDGMKSPNETSTLPSMCIGSVEVYTGGIPARYGDVTGGVVMMSMKGYFDILSERRAAESYR
jgi:hypothetical protein